MGDPEPRPADQRYWLRGCAVFSIRRVLKIGGSLRVGRGRSRPSRRGTTVLSLSTRGTCIYLMPIPEVHTIVMRNTRTMAITHRVHRVHHVHRVQLIMISTANW